MIYMGKNSMLETVTINYYNETIRVKLNMKKRRAIMVTSVRSNITLKCLKNRCRRN